MRGLYQTKKFLHNDRNYQQNNQIHDRTYLQQQIKLAVYIQNIQRAYTIQHLEKHSTYT